MTNREISPFPLRMAKDLRSWVQQRAQRNDRSVNAELNRILKKLRKEEEVQAVA